jgi:hypothetical protein
MADVCDPAYAKFIDGCVNSDLFSLHEASKSLGLGCLKELVEAKLASKIIARPVEEWPSLLGKNSSVSSKQTRITLVNPSLLIHSLETCTEPVFEPSSAPEQPQAAPSPVEKKSLDTKDAGHVGARDATSVGASPAAAMNTAQD